MYSFIGINEMIMECLDFTKEIGEHIKTIRLKKNYTREYLAEIADISPKFLYEIETGKKGCSSYVLYRLAIALNAKWVEILPKEQHINNSPQVIDIINMFSKDQREALYCIIKILYNIIYEL